MRSTSKMTRVDRTLINEWNERNGNMFARENSAIIYFYQYLLSICFWCAHSIARWTGAFWLRCQMLRSTSNHCIDAIMRTARSSLIGPIHLHLTMKRKQRAFQQMSETKGEKKTRPAHSTLHKCMLIIILVIGQTFQIAFEHILHCFHAELNGYCLWMWIEIISNTSRAREREEKKKQTKCL